MKKHPTHGAHARAPALRQDTTEAETPIWQILRSRQMKGHKFRRQVPIGRYIADFVCHEVRLIVEIDGGQHDRSSWRETVTRLSSSICTRRYRRRLGPSGLAVQASYPRAV
jgi:very-short-patch-repair endonuclease